MRLYALTPLLIAVANAMVIRKEKNNLTVDNEVVENFAPTPTNKDPTKVNNIRRAKTTEFIDIQNITIFEEGWPAWDDDWFESSWSVAEGDKVVDGVIKVDLGNNAGFSLQSKTLQSEYGYIYFDYKLSATDGNTKLNFISFDDGDYVNQGNWAYKDTDYVHIEQEIKNHSKGTFMSCIKRFAWQNYGNDNDFTLYLRRIVYRDMAIDIKKYDQAMSIIDEENCALASLWEDISEAKDRTSFEMVDGQCVMKITASEESPALYSLKNKDRKFHGGKLEITIRSQSDGSLFTWYALNSEDPSVEENENNPYSMTKEYQTFINEDFETEDEYNTLKILPVEDEVTYEIIKFNFSPITVDENIPLYDVTKIDEPDVILDENGLLWEDASWGSTQCQFQPISSAMECSFEGKQGSWPGFGFKTENDYDGGILLINMKVLNPDQNINILTFDRAENYHNVATFKATTEYSDYPVELPSFENYATYKYAIQEASQQDNTYYIRSIVYYPPYIPLPSKGATTTKKTTTRKRTTTTTTATTTAQAEPTFTPKTEEEKYEDIGYEGCSPNTKIAYADSTGIYGLENNEWCAILEKNIDSCWSVLYGYKCCSDNATIDGAWGTEADGTKCGNNASDACWAKDLGYDCCTRSESELGIVLVDESGAWGVKNNKWCGIK